MSLKKNFNRRKKLNLAFYGDEEDRLNVQIENLLRNFSKKVSPDEITKKRTAITLSNMFRELQVAGSYATTKELREQYNVPSVLFKEKYVKVLPTYEAAKLIEQIKNLLKNFSEKISPDEDTKRNTAITLNNAFLKLQNVGGSYDTINELREQYNVPSVLFKENYKPKVFHKKVVDLFNPEVERLKSLTKGRPSGPTRSPPSRNKLREKRNDLQMSFYGDEEDRLNVKIENLLNNYRMIKRPDKDTKKQTAIKLSNLFRELQVAGSYATTSELRDQYDVPSVLFKEEYEEPTDERPITEAERNREIIRLLSSVIRYKHNRPINELQMSFNKEEIRQAQIKLLEKNINKLCSEFNKLDTTEQKRVLANYIVKVMANIRRMYDMISLDVHTEIKIEYLIYALKDNKKDVRDFFDKALPDPKDWKKYLKTAAVDLTPPNRFYKNLEGKRFY
jgi:hypothetical protein